MCTNAVQYLIRDGALHACVQMRSNDAIYGYKNDRAWQQHVLEKLAADLNVPAGNLFWNVGSLHVYARHYHLVDPIKYPQEKK
jgi:thymidylate synthase